MPSLSPTMEKGNIAKWCKKEGEEVMPGDVLAEVETDKATMDYEMQEEGYVAKLLVNEGAQDIKLGELVAILVEDKNDIDAFKDYKPEGGEEKEKAPKKETSKKEEKKKSSKKEDKEKTEKLSKDVVTGKGEGISSKHEQATHQAREESAGKQGTSKTQKSSSQTSKYTSPKDFAGKSITERFNKTKVPQYQVTMECNLNNLIEVRERMNKVLDEPLSLNDFLIKAAALACKKFPDSNSEWLGDSIREYENVNANIAISSEKGCVYPVIPNIDKIGVSAINSALSDLTKRAANEELTKEDTALGTISISNFGKYGVTQASPIVISPQAIAIGIGAAERVVDADDESAVSSML